MNILLDHREKIRAHHRADEAETLEYLTSKFGPDKKHAHPYSRTGDTSRSGSAACFGSNANRELSWRIRPFLRRRPRADDIGGSPLTRPG